MTCRSLLYPLTFSAVPLVLLSCPLSLADEVRLRSLGNAEGIIDDLRWDIDFNSAFASQVEGVFGNCTYRYSFERDVSEITFDEEYRRDAEQHCFAPLLLVEVNRKVKAGIGGEFGLARESFYGWSAWRPEMRGLLYDEASRPYEVGALMGFNVSPILALGLSYASVRRPWTTSFNKEVFTDRISPLRHYYNRGHQGTVGLLMKTGRSTVGMSGAFSSLRQRYGDPTGFFSDMDVETFRSVKLRLIGRCEVNENLYVRTSFQLSKQAFEATHTGASGVSQQTAHSDLPHSLKLSAVFTPQANERHFVGITTQHFGSRSEYDDPGPSWSVQEYAEDEFSVHLGLEKSYWHRLTARVGSFWGLGYVRREGCGCYRNVIGEAKFLTFGLGLRLFKGAMLNIDFTEFPSAIAGDPDDYEDIDREIWLSFSLGEYGQEVH